MSRSTGSGIARRALRFGAMRVCLLRALVVIALVVGSALAIFADDAVALNTPDEEPIPEESVETYASTPVHDDYDPREAAHPLRIVAYAVHPVGVALDWIIVRPAVWVGRHEPFRTIFGFDD